jgi:hypothetical protein
MRILLIALALWVGAWGLGRGLGEGAKAVSWHFEVVRVCGGQAWKEGASTPVDPYLKKGSQRASERCAELGFRTD